ncbi:hypothetical protein [Mycoplasma bradburyae]|uniref:Uncharacterized protein n=1 Tax=Mycoplasma bradburyae TaxID=2963128 RepID=A0AAW6HPI9_9MOLU|nr:hypothetical protein [Mycoplasma bradburyae]MDC4183742.1 hypothetical protein [Mycoplasma bradburyae]UTS70795.1 hypothetical protein NMG77_03530 [Mycoplasma bradburyae]
MLEKIALNWIKICFSMNILNQKIVTDTTEFKYYLINEKGVKVTEKLYSGPFIDLCNGEIISYSISKQPSSQNIMNVLNKVIKVTSEVVLIVEPFIQI